MATRNLKYVSRDTADSLVSKIVTLWPITVVHVSSSAQAGPGETERGQKTTARSALRHGRGGEKIERWAVALGDLEDRGLPADMWKRYRKGDRFWVVKEADAEHYWAEKETADGLNAAKIRRDEVAFEQPYPDSPGASAVPSHSGGESIERWAKAIRSYEASEKKFDIWSKFEVPQVPVLSCVYQLSSASWYFRCVLILLVAPGARSILYHPVSQ